MKVMALATVPKAQHRHALTRLVPTWGLTKRTTTGQETGSTSASYTSVINTKHNKKTHKKHSSVSRWNLNNVETANYGEGSKMRIFVSQNPVFLERTRRTVLFVWLLVALLSVGSQGKLYVRNLPTARVWSRMPVCL
jgi:hypothetical protein